MTGDQLYHLFLYSMIFFWALFPPWQRKKLHSQDLERFQVSVDLATEQSRAALAEIARLKASLAWLNREAEVLQATTAELMGFLESARREGGYQQDAN